MKGVYLVTDNRLCGPQGVEQVVSQAAAAGLCCVQLREKTTPTGLFIARAQRVKNILAPHHIPLIINDRVDVALAVGAAGVHVGQSDMPPEIARRLLGPEAIVGLSVESWADVEKAQDLDVNYLGISPVFSTATKTDTKNPWGIDGVARMAAFSRHPLVGIGGLDAHSLGAVVQAGADCIAVVSAICAAPDPYGATLQLKAAIEKALALEARSAHRTGRTSPGSPPEVAC